MARTAVTLIRKGVVGLYRQLFGRAQFYRFNVFLHELSLHGLGILNYENERVSGEDRILDVVLRGNGARGTILDVGANVGNYARAIRKRDAHVEVYAFEPHPTTFKATEAAAKAEGFVAINAACGEADGEMTLYDYAAGSGSEHASAYSEVIERIHSSKAVGHKVRVRSVDSFLAEHQIDKVRLLKVDTEGYEHAVLLGAQKGLRDGVFDFIQFEFNEMNVVSKTFFRDFVDLLPNYILYRALPDGFVRLAYQPVTCEIFAFQNILAVRADIAKEIF